MSRAAFIPRKGRRRPTGPTGDLGVGGNPGKGDVPRNCFSKEFRENYDLIDWKSPRKTGESPIV